MLTPIIFEIKKVSHVCLFSTNEVKRKMATWQEKGEDWFPRIKIFFKRDEEGLEALGRKRLDFIKVNGPMVKIEWITK